MVGNSDPFCFSLARHRQTMGTWQGQLSIFASANIAYCTAGDPWRPGGCLIFQDGDVKGSSFDSTSSTRKQSHLKGLDLDHLRSIKQTQNRSPSFVLADPLTQNHKSTLHCFTELGSSCINCAMRLKWPCRVPRITRAKLKPVKCRQKNVEANVSKITEVSHFGNSSWIPDRPRRWSRVQGNLPGNPI